MSEEFQIEELKPGILILEKVSLVGGISYKRTYLDEKIEDKAKFRKWETEAIIEDEEELIEGRRLRTAAYKDIRNICANTPAGLICPVEDIPKLVKAIEEIEERTKEFNLEAQTCRMVTRYTPYGISPGNSKVIASIADQIASTAGLVEDYIKDNNLSILRKCQRKIRLGHTPEDVLQLPEEERDVIIAQARAQLIRSAVQKMGSVDQILNEEPSEKVRDLVRNSSQIARSLIKNVTKRDLTIEQALSEVDTTGIRSTRLAFVGAAMSADEKPFSEIEIYSVPEDNSSSRTIGQLSAPEVAEEFVEQPEVHNVTE